MWPFKNVKKDVRHWKTASGSNWMDKEGRRVVGFSDLKPSVDDFLFSPMQSGKTGVFMFKSVEPCGDPHDMFFGTVEGLGYEEDVKHDKTLVKHSMGYVF